MGGTMRRPSYFSRIATKASARGAVAVLAPPRLLFRPSIGVPEVQEIEARSEARAPTTPVTPRRTVAAAARTAAAPARGALPSAASVAASRAEAPLSSPPDRVTEPASAMLAATIPPRSSAAPGAASAAPGVALQVPLPASGTGQAQATPAVPTPPGSPAARPPGRAAAWVSNVSRTDRGTPPDPAPGRSEPPRAKPPRSDREHLPRRIEPSPPPRRAYPQNEAAARPVLAPPPAPPPPPAAPSPPPRLHIGTLEVRVLPPAPPQAAAPRPVLRGPVRRAAAGPIARGFGVFGLGQS